MKNAVLSGLRQAFGPRFLAGVLALEVSFDGHQTHQQEDDGQHQENGDTCTANTSQ